MRVIIPQRQMGKLVLNSLIGRFGMDVNKTVSKLVDMEQHNVIISSRILKNSIKIDNNVYLDSYFPGINKDICEQSDLDYNKVINDREYKKIYVKGVIIIDNIDDVNSNILTITA